MSMRCEHLLSFESSGPVRGPRSPATLIEPRTGSIDRDAGANIRTFPPVRDHDSFDLVVVADRTLDSTVIKNPQPLPSLRRGCSPGRAVPENLLAHHRTPHAVQISRFADAARGPRLCSGVRVRCFPRFALTCEPIVHRESDREFRSGRKTRVVEGKDEAKRLDQIGCDLEQGLRAL
jgi:hypothetical protein